jgi:hypothetical protein
MVWSGATGEIHAGVAAPRTYRMTEKRLASGAGCISYEGREYGVGG